jgi:hypothetical protein
MQPAIGFFLYLLATASHKLGVQLQQEHIGTDSKSLYNKAIGSFLETLEQLFHLHA